MCPMCERRIGEDTPRVCRHCGWELFQHDESAAWVTSLDPRLGEPVSHKQ